jgi:hypothetical protein
MTKLQRYVFFRQKGFRHTLAWYCAGLPRWNTGTLWNTWWVVICTMSILIYLGIMK